MTFEVKFSKDESFLKHEKFIRESWEHYSLKFHMLNTSQEQFKLLKEAKQYFLEKKNIDREAKSILMKWFNRNINHAREYVISNGSASASQSSQSDETLIASESTQEGQNTGKPVEKIDWEAGLAELAFMFEILFKNEEIGCSMKQYKKRWALVAKHFTVKGKAITNIDLKSAFIGIQNSKSGKIRKHKMYEDLIELTRKVRISPEE